LLINGFGKGRLENVNFIRENDVIKIGTEELHVIETPGHTDNDIMLIDYKNRLIFTGDTLLRGRLPRQLVNYKNLMSSISKILYYPQISEEFIIYPGHGGTSTIGEERLNY
jgi:glyoxylase-like metal-dependent hydrolase (beta-lactamase superfamily II)